MINFYGREKKLRNENEVEDLYGGDRIRRDGKVYKNFTELTTSSYLCCTYDEG